MFVFLIIQGIIELIWMEHVFLSNVFFYWNRYVLSCTFCWGSVFKLPTSDNNVIVIVIQLAFAITFFFTHVLETDTIKKNKIVSALLRGKSKLTSSISVGFLHWFGHWK